MLRALKIALLLSLLVLMITALTVTAQQSVTPVASDVLYAGDAATSDLLDVYVPDIGTSPYPVVVMFTTSSGSKSDLTDFGTPQFVVGLGYAAITIGYRTTLPDVYSDAFCALAWVYANAEQYNLDISQIALYGVSWGGMTSAFIAGTTDPTSYLTNCPNQLPAHHTLRGVIADAGAYFSVPDMYAEFLSSGLIPDVANLPADTLTQTLSTLRATPPEQWSTLPFPDDILTVLDEFPIFQVKGREPPYLLIQGVGDSIVPYADALNYASALLKHHVKVELVFDPLSGHPVNLSLYDGEMATFLKRIFH